MRLVLTLVLPVALLAALSGCQAQSGDAASQRPVAVLMGYWPPTNEMLRQWSQSLEQNPAGWQGENWRGLGFDVVAFFPEFPPDGDPTNDAIGDPGSVGSVDSDLRVDFQDTSRDFWRIVDAHNPRVLITTSRGGSIAWELEAVEGGHGNGSADPAMDWRSDEHGVGQPTQASVDERSWQMMARYRAGQRLSSTLPMRLIAEQVGNVAVIDEGTSGNYLSGFLGLHGLYYQSLNPSVAAAGHIHVGRQVSVEDATRMMERSLEVTLRSARPR